VSVRGEALTVMLSPRRYAAPRCLLWLQLEDWLQLARGAYVQAKTNVTIARAPAPSVHFAHSRMCMATSRGCACMFASPAVSQDGSLGYTPLRGVSAIANTRLGQSGSGPQRDTVHNKSLQRMLYIDADCTGHTSSPRLARCVMLSRCGYRNR
jgi:hypothetical protein